jgi:hypothetical protein
MYWKNSLPLTVPVARLQFSIHPPKTTPPNSKGQNYPEFFVLRSRFSGFFALPAHLRPALRPPKAQALKTSGAQHFWWAEGGSTKINPHQQSNNKQRGTMAAEG